MEKVTQKKSYLWMSLMALILGLFAYVTYVESTPKIFMDGHLFLFTNGANSLDSPYYLGDPNSRIQAEDIGQLIGEVEKTTFWLKPMREGTGFRVPKGTKLYIFKDIMSSGYANYYTPVIAEIEDRYYACVANVGGDPLDLRQFRKDYGYPDSLPYPSS